LKNEARNRCLICDTRANREGYEQKIKDATKICRKKKCKMINNESPFKVTIKRNIVNSIKR
jgi:hypothetical protein